MPYQEIPPIISVFFCLLLAIFVGAKGLKHATNIGFALGMIGLALKETSAGMIAIFPENSLFFWKQTFLFSQAFMGGGWLLFSAALARANTSLFFKKWRLLFVAYYITLFLSWWTPFFSMGTNAVSASQTLQVGKPGLFFFFIHLLMMVISLMNLEQTYRASSGTPRYTIKYMLLGTGAILILEAYRAGEVLFYSAIDLSVLPFYSSALVFAYGLIAFSVVRHRLLNVHIFVSRHAIYKSATLLAVVTYLSIFGIMMVGVEHFRDGKYAHLIPLLIFAALLGMAILLLSEGLRRQMQTFVNVNFFRNKYDYRDNWQTFTKTVCAKHSLTELLPALVSWVSSTIGSNDAAIWLLDPERNRYYLASRRSFFSAPATWSDTGPLATAMNAQSAPLELITSKGLYKTIQQESPEFFDAYPDTVWVSVTLDQKMLGILALGLKITKDPYDYHDMELLMTVSEHAAGQIDRVRVIEELAVVKELKAMHTLSSFFLHDLKNYAATLSLLAKNVKVQGQNPKFQQNAFETIEVTVDKMNQLIHHITVVAKGQVLTRSEIDISQLLELTLSGLKGALGLKGNIYLILADLPSISADPEQLANVFRNLIINACNAVDNEGTVNIETRMENNRIYISIRDNGCGMSEEFISSKLFKPLRTNKAAGWGIGLFQCQQIMKAHGGKISVNSVTGEGSTFTVELPFVNK